MEPSLSDASAMVLCRLTSLFRGMSGTLSKEIIWKDGTHSKIQLSNSWKHYISSLAGNRDQNSEKA